jgi:flagellar biosynthesis protein FlhA
VGRAIVGGIASDGSLSVITLEPGLEAAMHEGLRPVDGTTFLVVDPNVLDVVRRDAEQAMTEAARRRRPVALVVSQQLRGPLQKTIRGAGLDLPVLAYPELTQDLELEPIGVIGGALAQA